MKSGFKALIPFLFLVLVNLVLTQDSTGRIIIYPFVILSTWFHEIGHGLFALILGGSVLKIELFPDGSGLATFTQPNLFGGLGNAFVALGGPLFPPIMGFFYVVSSKNLNLTRLVLLLTSFAIILTLVLWVRTIFGGIFLLIISLLLFFSAISKFSGFQIFLTRVIGIQAFLSVYLSLGYLFSQGGVVQQSSFTSDTQVVAQYTFLPYWFWAILIIVITLTLFFFAMKSIWKGTKQSPQ
ncbi:MAG: M50 family metallopeptidase [Ignavibacteria bacterium]|nr:M50 family metallopeptidase [Ignavibacteria bacterium]